MNYSQHRNDFERAILDSKLSANQKLIALALKSHMNNSDGRCFPSIKTLAAECSLSEKTVRKDLKELETAGFISKISGNGRGNTTQYFLHPIQSDVDNVNKHKGNPSTLLPNYSPNKETNPSDFPDDDFEVEIQSKRANTQINSKEVAQSTTITNHFDSLTFEEHHRARRSIEHHGYYFNEHYRKYLYADGNEVELDGDDF